MTGPDQGFAESVARFKADVSAAVTRARRASAEARDTTAGFRRESDELSDKLRAGEARADGSTDAERRAMAADWRRAQGLPVEEFPSEQDGRPAPPRATVDPEDDDPEDDDEDFSQHSILYRGR